MTWPTLHQENKTYCLKSFKKLSFYNHAVWEEEKGVTFPFLVVPRSFFAPKSHRNACFASYRGTDYVQQKKQYNQSIKLSGELLLSGSFISFVMTVPTERRNKLLLWNLYDYKKATRGDWFLPTYFWRFAISICRHKKMIIFLDIFTGKLNDPYLLYRF